MRGPDRYNVATLMNQRSSIRYREYVPAAALRPFVECVWAVWDSARRESRAPDRVVPDACPEIIMHLGDPFARLAEARWRRQPAVFLAGTLSRPWLLRAGTRVRTLGIRFRPGAVTAFFAIHMQEATDREVTLAAVCGAREAREFARAVRGADRGAGAGVGVAPRGALHAAEQWLIARLGESSNRSADVTRPAVRAILRSGGGARIADLALELGVHRRRLERAFACDLGIRPKLFARIVRLNAALAKLDPAERVRAVDWALDAGYFDQAHLSREFRAITGRRAGASRDADGEMARHFTDPRRLVAYLRGE